MTLVCQCCIKVNLASGGAGVVLLLQQNRLPSLCLCFQPVTRHNPTDQVVRTKRAVVQQQQPHFRCTHEMVCAKASAQLWVSLGEKRRLEENDGQKPCRYIVISEIALLIYCFSPFIRKLFETEEWHVFSFDESATSTRCNDAWILFNLNKLPLFYFTKSNLTRFWHSCSFVMQFWKETKRPAIPMLSYHFVPMRNKTCLEKKRSALAHVHWFPL